MENKYFFHIRKAVPVAFVIGTILVVIIWLWILGLGKEELSMVANIFMPIILLVAITGVIGQLFVSPRWHYAKLAEDSILINAGLPFPTWNFKYSEIKKINFSGGKLLGIDTGRYMPWPIHLRLKKPGEFIEALSKSYERNTGKKLPVN
jgi:hypothetical protein